MSRTIIGAVVTVAIVTLTALTYVVVQSGLEARVRDDAAALMQRGRLPQQALNNATLSALDVQKKVELLAKDPNVVAALRADNQIDRMREANLAFQRYVTGAAEPDILALVDRFGNIIAKDGVNKPVAGEFKGKDGGIAWPGLALSLGDQRIFLSEVWNYPGQGLLRVGIGSVVDNDVAGETPGEPSEGGAGTDDRAKVNVIGGVVLAYALSSKAARDQQTVLGADVAYFDSGQVFATSFRRGGDSSTEDTRMQGALAPTVKNAKVVPAALSGDAGVAVGGKVSAPGGPYLVAAIRMPRFASSHLPDDYPAVTAGALVLVPTQRDVPQHGTAGRLILVLGGVALVLALGAMFLTSRRILEQVDEIEVGVAEIINGNLERTFRPVGDDLDGLANGLNVMLARLLGRPEPGEEEMDEDGNPVVPGRVEFDDAAPKPDAGDPELAALAHEPEPDYYKRVYTEYLEARRQTGNPDEVSFEGFIAKLRVTEGKLKALHQCRAVRFRVVVSDNKVTLKPVPIF